MMNPPPVEFYTRPGCHLCHEALAVLQELQRELAFEIQIVDISESERLTELYGNDIPVAALEGEKIFKYRADAKKLRTILMGRGIGLRSDAESDLPPP